MFGAHLPYWEVHLYVLTLHGEYLAVLQSAPPSLWRGHFVSWEITVLRAGLKRVELHIQRKNKPTFDTKAYQGQTIPVD